MCRALAKTKHAEHSTAAARAPQPDGGIDPGSAARPARMEPRPIEISDGIRMGSGLLTQRQETEGV